MQAVHALAEIWRERTGKQLGLGLDTEIGPSKRQQLFYPGPRFVEVIVQAIDPSLTTAEIGTALRKSLGKRALQKSDRKSD